MSLRLQIRPLLRANFLMPLTIPEPAPAVHTDPAQNTLEDDGHEAIISSNYQCFQRVVATNII